MDSSSGSLERCLENALAGDEILLPSSTTIESGSLLIDKNLTFRSSNPGEPAVWVHETYEDFGGDPFAESHLPVAPLLTVEKGAVVDLADLEIIPMTYNIEEKDYTVARLISVTGGANVAARNISVDGIIGAYAGAPSSQPGGYVGYVSDAGSSLTFEDCTLRNIKADDHFGGVAYARNSGTILFTGSTVVEWSTAWSGGVAYAQFGGIISTEPNADSVTPTFSDNYASAFGGVFFVRGGGSNLDIEGGAFERNIAQSGGSIAIAGAGGSVQNARIQSGFAAFGGAIYAEDNPEKVSVGSGSELIGNSATLSGGALHIEGSSLVVEDSVLRDNSADQPDGVAGGLVVYGGTAKVENCQFIGNTAGVGAGGIQLEGVGDSTEEGAVQILGSVFVGNSGQGAGALQVFSSSRVDEVIQGNRFCGNGASREGGAVSLGGTVGSEVLFENNVVDGNNLAGDGPEIALFNRTFTVKHNTFLRMNRLVFDAQFGTGSFTRNVVTWVETDVPVVADFLGEANENVWFDPDSAWSAAVEVGGEPIALGPSSVMGDPRFTRGDTADDFPLGCAAQDYALRPDTAAVLTSTWDAPGVRDEIVGHWARSEPPNPLWSDDEDGDGVVALWDCDDSAQTGDERQEGVPEYRDADGDGFAGELVSKYSCDIAAGNSATSDDCDEGNPEIHECGEDPDPDPDPEDEVFWYGSGCASSPGGGTSLVFIGLVPLLRCRRRRVV